MENKDKKIDEFDEYMCRSFEEEMSRFFKAKPERGIIVCQYCNGTGMSIDMACSVCNGRGMFKFQIMPQ